jgi:ATP-dependent Clp protease ATP-binding subunit ClpC
MSQFDVEVKSLIQTARDKAVELGSPSVYSELLLYAILNTKNSGLEFLEKQAGNLGILKSSVTSRLNDLKRETNQRITMPNVSWQVMHTFKLAEILASTSPINGSHLIQALGRARDSIAGNLLRDSGFFLDGDKQRKSKLQKSAATPFLDAVSLDLTALAIQEKLDPVIGRDEELERIIEILAKRKKNNPVLIGEPGVGKTAVVEGLAIRIVSGNVPEILMGKRVVSLDLNSIISGTQFRGQFEKRMQIIISELIKAPNVILFIDELHTIKNAGGMEGTGDVGSIIKPALSRGMIRCIGATTFDDYRKHIETDGALERRFQKVIIEAPSLDKVREILNNVKELYQLFHSVSYSTSALESIVYLADRYISDRKFPDKAIDILDESGAITRLAKKSIVEDIDVQKVVSRISGVPVVNLGKSERTRLLTMEQDLSLKVVGQNPAIKEVAYAIKRAKTQIHNPNLPISFLFLGPTGVGKTETAKQLAYYLFDSVDSLIRIDMSEYSEKFTVSRLVGAPPGYVGYDEGGQLTERIRRKPYSVVLFDEIEKAHPDVFDIFLQILDEGKVTDAGGRIINFRNTVIIMTANVGASVAKHGSMGFGEMTRSDELTKNYTDSLKQYFKPEFINRIGSMIVFNQLGKEDIRKIIGLLLEELNTRIKITLTESAVDYFTEHGYSTEYGARYLKRVLTKEVENPLADLILSNPEITSFSVDCMDGKITVSPS